MNLYDRVTKIRQVAKRFIFVDNLYGYYYYVLIKPGNTSMSPSRVYTIKL